MGRRPSGGKTNQTATKRDERREPEIETKRNDSYTPFHDSVVGSTVKDISTAWLLLPDLSVQ